VKQAKLTSRHTRPNFKFGVEVEVPLIGMMLSIWTRKK